MVRVRFIHNPTTGDVKWEYISGSADNFAYNGYKEIEIETNRGMINLGVKQWLCDHDLVDIIGDISPILNHICVRATWTVKNNYESICLNIHDPITKTNAEYNFNQFNLRIIRENIKSYLVTIEKNIIQWVLSQLDHSQPDHDFHEQERASIENVFNQIESRVELQSDGDVRLLDGPSDNKNFGKYKMASAQVEKTAKSDSKSDKKEKTQEVTIQDVAIDGKYNPALFIPATQFGMDGILQSLIQRGLDSVEVRKLIHRDLIDAKSDRCSDVFRERNHKSSDFKLANIDTCCYCGVKSSSGGPLAGALSGSAEHYLFFTVAHIDDILLKEAMKLKDEKTRDSCAFKLVNVWSLETKVRDVRSQDPLIVNGGCVFVGLSRCSKCMQTKASVCLE
jgi:hypothetical protein